MPSVRHAIVAAFASGLLRVGFAFFAEKSRFTFGFAFHLFKASGQPLILFLMSMSMFACCCSSSDLLSGQSTVILDTSMIPESWSNQPKFSKARFGRVNKCPWISPYPSSVIDR